MRNLKQTTNPVPEPLLLFNPPLDAFIYIIAFGRAAFDEMLKLSGAVTDAIVAGLSAVSLAYHYL